MRRYVLAGQVRPGQAEEALANLAALSIDRWPTRELVGRAFELRDNVTVYDGVHLALAESLGAALLTGDAGLAAVPGCAVDVEVVSTLA